MGVPDADGAGPDGLPGLPPEWGRVVVPDDASALADEAAQLRRELRRQSRAPGGRKLRRADRSGTGRPGPARLPARAARRSPLTVPLVVLLVAVLTTAVGALAGWPRPQRAASRPQVTPDAPVAGAAGRALPALDLVDAAQSPVPLRGLLPAVILLVDECPCRAEIATVAAAAPPGVSVVTVVSGRSAPAVAALSGTGPSVRPLADPAGGLRAFLQLRPGPGTATAILVDRSGTLVRVLPVVGPAEEYRADLTRLGSG